MGDMKALGEGLKLLNRADNAIEVTVAETGEYLISTSGELHLERCVKDLQDRYAPGLVRTPVSKPIVSFLETIVSSDGQGLARKVAQAKRELQLPENSNEELLAVFPKFALEARDETAECFALYHAELEKTDEKALWNQMRPGVLFKLDELRKLVSDKLGAAIDKCKIALNELDDETDVGGGRFNYQNKWGDAAPVVLEQLAALDREQRQDQLVDVTKQRGRLKGLYDFMTLLHELEVDDRLLRDYATIFLFAHPNVNREGFASSAFVDWYRKTHANPVPLPDPGKMSYDQLIEIMPRFELTTKGSEAVLRQILQKHIVAELPDESAFQKDDPHAPGTVEIYTPNRKCHLLLRAVPLPAKLAAFLESRADRIGRIIHNLVHGQAARKRDFKLFDQMASRVPKDCPDLTPEDMHLVAALGPKSIGANLLVVREKAFAEFAPLVKRLERFGAPSQQGQAGEREDFLKSIMNTIRSRFQFTTSLGPLCNEPMHGVAFILEKAECEPWDTAQDGDDQYGPVTGQMMSVMKEAFLEAFLAQSPRLVQPMFKVFVQGNAYVLGCIYDVIHQRKGKITSEDIVPGTDLFDVYATLPVCESFGFSKQLRTQTGGYVAPQLVFSNWEVVTEDPFWVPTTEEELEEFGHDAKNIENYARQLVNNIRERKGLYVERKVVEDFASKQRTRARKK